MTTRNRWLKLLIVVLIVVGLLYCAREQLERVIVAYGTYHSQVFTPPPHDFKESWWDEHYDHVRFYWDISKLHVEREKRLKLLNPELQPLVQEIRRRQTAGQGMQYSMHIYREVRWRLNFTPDIATTRSRIAIYLSSGTYCALLLNSGRTLGPDVGASGWSIVKDGYGRWMTWR